MRLRERTRRRHCQFAKQRRRRRRWRIDIAASARRRAGALRRTLDTVWRVAFGDSGIRCRGRVGACRSLGTVHARRWTARALAGRVTAHARSSRRRCCCCRRRRSRRNRILCNSRRRWMIKLATMSVGCHHTSMAVHALALRPVRNRWLWRFRDGASRWLERSLQCFSNSTAYCGRVLGVDRRVQRIATVVNGRKTNLNGQWILVDK